MLVVGGDLGMAVMARMAAGSRRPLRRGLTSIATRVAPRWFTGGGPTGTMFHGVETPAELALTADRATVIAIGPGLGPQRLGQNLATRRPRQRQTAGGGRRRIESAGRRSGSSRALILTLHPGAEVEADHFTAPRNWRYASVAWRCSRFR